LERAVGDVETIGRIRREHFLKGKSIKEIARDLKISRNTVRRVLRSDETSFSYEREIQPRPKLGRWKSEIDRMLAQNASGAARERLTLIRRFEELRALGYEGGYDAVRRYAKTWTREHASQTASAYIPLWFAPGEAYQFDWSHEIVVLSRVRMFASATAAFCSFAPIRVRPRRWCSTRTTELSPSSRAPARAASTTT
jgi:transposase